MSWSIPVVASRVGGIPEMIDSGVEGLLVEPGDVDGILDAILHLAADRELLPRMGRAARKRVESEFSKDVVLPKMEAIYEKLSRT
jgi:glycosyltransferase involved in cell wall biosynthesis